MRQELLMIVVLRHCFDNNRAGALNPTRVDNASLACSQSYRQLLWTNATELQQRNLHCMFGQHPSTLKRIRYKTG